MFFRGIRAANIRAQGCQYRLPVGLEGGPAGSLGGRAVFHLSERTPFVGTVQRTDLQRVVLCTRRFYSTDSDDVSEVTDASLQSRYDQFEETYGFEVDTVVHEGMEYFYRGKLEYAYHILERPAALGHPEAKAACEFMDIRNKGILDKKGEEMLEAASSHDFYYLWPLLKQGEDSKTEHGRAYQSLLKAAQGGNLEADYLITAGRCGRGLSSPEWKMEESRLESTVASGTLFVLNLKLEDGDLSEADRESSETYRERERVKCRRLAYLYAIEAYETRDESKAEQLRERSLKWLKEAACLRDLQAMADLADMNRQSLNKLAAERTRR